MSSQRDTTSFYRLGAGKGGYAIDPKPSRRDRTGINNCSWGGMGGGKVEDNRNIGEQKIEDPHKVKKRWGCVSPC